MTPEQHRFVLHIADWIPRLFAAIAQGNEKSEIRLGMRLVNNQHVILKLMVEVEDVDPLPQDQKVLRGKSDNSD